MAEALPATATIFDVKEEAFAAEAVVQCMQERGFCVLRNLFELSELDEVGERTRALLRKPAVAGTLGYSKVDFPKKLINPFHVGGPIVPMMLNEIAIDIIERHMESDCILAETNLKFDAGVNYEYFPIHSDFAAGWKKRKDQDFALTEEGMKDPVGIGVAIYLHDTQEGAFVFCEGTHKLLSPHGQNLAAYSADMQKSILSKRVRCEGLRGDLVMFDDRGFHGPDHPSKADRLMILLDYFRVKTFGHTQVTPQPVWTSDLGGLSQTQMRVLGIGADYMVPPIDYAKTRYKYSSMYGLICSLINKTYLVTHIKNKAKKALGRA